jgi:tRNA1Val (adenine37-N6)-methyltransferase
MLYSLAPLPYPSEWCMFDMERYVPSDEASSLVADAPGYSDANDVGPVCWKCRGCNTVVRKRRLSQQHPDELAAAPLVGDLSGSKMTMTSCSVCQGTGRLDARRVLDSPGKITRGRRSHRGSTLELGPDPAGYSVLGYGTLVKQATDNCQDFIVTEEVRSSGVPPVWLPDRTEELCNLTGKWRILQRVGSHRWTTDDLVTAAIAAKELRELFANLRSIRNDVGHQNNNDPNSAHSDDGGLSYCDLGTGNASVLQMVLWKAKESVILIRHAMGIEARSEAVGLARRSLAFNLGESSSSIIHADFRSFCRSQQHPPKHDEQYCGAFDLVTGTPPYFRVDFDIDSQSNIVQKATIRQGGMPSSVQSAPARCEFRGGFEAYCEAAHWLLKKGSGILCVCENYQNHTRALAALEAHHLGLVKLYRIEGKVGRGTLFCVYVAKRIDEDQSACGAVEEAAFAVRSANGEWTTEYVTEILDFMSIMT